MVAIPLDKINYNKVSKYANDLIFKEFYPKTKNVSYYLKVFLHKSLEFFFLNPKTQGLVASVLQKCNMFYNQIFMIRDERNRM